jgi:hypothetical protein
MEPGPRTQADIERLGDKLGAMPDLSDDERGLLTEIFAVAVEAITTDPAADPTAPLGTAQPAGSPVRDQFVAAFEPGALSDAAVLMRKVGGGVQPT